MEHSKISVHTCTHKHIVTKHNTYVCVCVCVCMCVCIPMHSTLWPTPYTHAVHLTQVAVYLGIRLIQLGYSALWKAKLIRMPTFIQLGHPALWEAKVEDNHFHTTSWFCDLKVKFQDGYIHPIRLCRRQMVHSHIQPAVDFWKARATKWWNAHR